MEENKNIVNNEDAKVIETENIATETKEDLTIENDTVSSENETISEKEQKKIDKENKKLQKKEEQEKKKQEVTEKVDNAIQVQKEKLKKLKPSKGRASEIFSVFTKHGFYMNGLTPEELRTTLEDLGPTYVKIGQIMSSRTDMLPLSYCKELEKLRSTVKPLPAEIARQVIEEETGKKIDEIYSEFRDKPLGSASIAQAHFGILKDGTKVVTKVQRPLIADLMRKDFVLLKKLASAFSIAQEADDSNLVDLKSVIGELEKVTEEELNFKVEAENTKQFRENCIDDETVISCPTIIDEYTTERILTMSYVDGYSISKVDRIKEEGYDPEEIAKVIIENYIHQVFDTGIFHADPHQGNIMVSHGVPYWIDFGMIGHISDANINLIQNLVLALLQRDVDEVTNLSLSMGIQKGKLNKSKYMDDVEALIEKYMSTSDLSQIDVAAILQDLTNTMQVHNISMPSEYTMLLRSLVTIEGVLASIAPNLNLFSYVSKKMFERVKENFDIKEKLTNLLESVATTGMKAAKLPSIAFGVLRNIAKGRLKINFELSGYDDMIEKIKEIVKYAILAVFSSVLFAGSVSFASLDITPKINNLPLVSLMGFIFSIALAIYIVIKLTKKKK